MERQLSLDFETPQDRSISAAAIDPAREDTREVVAAMFAGDQPSAESERDPVSSESRESPGQGGMDSLDSQHRLYTLTDFGAFYESSRQQLPAVEVWRSEYERLRSNKATFIGGLLSGHNATQLKVLASRFGCFTAKRQTKQENAEAVYHGCLRQFVLGNSIQYDPMRERLEDAIDRIVAGYTAEDFATHAAEQRTQQLEHRQAIENPQTLADFALFVREMGEVKLSDEQHLRRDRLKADLTRENRRQAQGVSVERFEAESLGDLGMTIKEGYHDKRQCPLWIVQLGERVDKTAFGELKAKAKQLGGWYSSFKRGDSGFQFLSQESAEKFAGLQQGNADRSEELLDRQIRKLGNAGERFAAMADRLMQQAEATLAADEDKLKNTARRAAQAASTRANAQADIARAKTLQSLASQLTEGEGGYLDGVRFAVQIDTLGKLLRQAKWKHVRRQMDTEHEDLSAYARGLKQDELEHRPVDATDIRYAEYPKPYVYRDHIEKAIAQHGNTNGVKQVAAKMQKLLRRTSVERDYVEFTYDHDIALLADFISRVRAAGFDCYWFEHCLDDHSRLRKANIHDEHELRAALAELLPHLKPAEGDDPVTVAIDELRGKKLPGFFPTPRPVINLMLEEAEIGAGDRVLEPSAGMGDILDAVRREHPDVDLVAIERNRSLSDVLVAKGYEGLTEFGDFLEHRGEYDRVMMNPPFEQGQDIEHVRHAYALLKPGGRLVSVMCRGPFFREDQKSKLFRAWLDELDGDVEDLPDDAFQGVEAFRQTGVRTCLLTLTKPGDEQH